MLSVRAARTDLQRLSRLTHLHCLTLDRYRFHSERMPHTHRLVLVPPLVHIYTYSGAWGLWYSDHSVLVSLALETAGSRSRGWRLRLRALEVALKPRRRGMRYYRFAVHESGHPLSLRHLPRLSANAVQAKED